MNLLLQNLNSQPAAAETTVNVNTRAKVATGRMVVRIIVNDTRAIALASPNTAEIPALRSNREFTARTPTES